MARDPNPDGPFDPFDGNPSDVDWNRYATGTRSRALDQTGADHTALGDPTRWGVETDFVFSGVAGTYNTRQFLRAETVDPYSRAWMIAGACLLPAAVVNPTVFNAMVFVLDVEMGVGQTILRHRFNLSALMMLATGGSISGTFPPGPPWYIPINEGGLFSVPWVITGGLYGHAINARASVLIGESIEGLGSVNAKISAVASALAVGYPL